MRAFELLGRGQAMNTLVFQSSYARWVKRWAFDAFDEVGGRVVHVEVAQAIACEFIVATFAFHVAGNGIVGITNSLVYVADGHGTVTIGNLMWGAGRLLSGCLNFNWWLRK